MSIVNFVGNFVGNVMESTHMTVSEDTHSLTAYFLDKHLSAANLVVISPSFLVLHGGI